MSRKMNSIFRAGNPLPECLVAVIALSAFAVAPDSGADPISVPNTFTDGTTALADQVNENYDVIVVESNDQDSRIADTEAELSGLRLCSGADQRVYHNGIGSTLRCYTPPTKYLSIPSSAFTPRTGSIDGNSSGTARYFAVNEPLFAPVNLPHNSVVTRLDCGGNDASSRALLRFVLRRNQPQQANVDMATADTVTGEFGFKFISDTSIVSATINNLSYNYFLRASIEGPFFAGFTVGFCRIHYTEALLW